MTIAPGLRKPKLKADDSRLFEAEVRAANVLDEWMRRRGVTVSELADDWGVSETVVRDLRTRQRVLTVGRILLVRSARARRHLFDLLSDVEIEPASAA